MGHLSFIMAPPKTLNFITGNKNKLTEVKAILGDTIELQSQKLDLVEIQGSIEEISSDKCRRAADIVCATTPILCLLDVNMQDRFKAQFWWKTHALICERIFYWGRWFSQAGGMLMLSLFRKWFLDALGHKGLNDMLAGFEDKSAQAVCTFAYCEGPGHEPIIFQGRTDGKIVPARGPSNFGWDPIFEYDGKTYAEMEKVEKNKISHRFRALEKLKTWLQEA
ncbi:inosine triphosphate pyrophosphatase protein [Rutstroemia sp. NJR-2017a BVV2]|nr:inosine triphosphate pyrophosphatase protein [Rutstroemia sp. NJR-2017a BVV2]